MASLNQLADHISNLINVPFSHELRERIKDSFRFLAASRIRQSVEKNGLDNQFVSSYISGLKQVDSFDTCFTSSGCTILRTINKVATPVRYKSDVPFSFVGTPDGVPILYSRRSEIRYRKYLKYIGKSMSYTYDDGYIYVFGNTRIKQIKIQDIFLNPEEAVTVCSTNSNCVTDDTEFPIPTDMIYSIIQEILKSEFGIIKPETLGVPINDVPE